MTDRMIDRLQRVVLTTDALDDTVTDYETLLAAKPHLASLPDTPDASTNRRAFFDVGNTTLEIRQASGARSRDGDGEAGSPEPSILSALVLETNDPDKAFDRLASARHSTEPGSQHHLTLDPEVTGGLQIHLATPDARHLWSTDGSAVPPPNGAVTGLDHVVVRSRDADATRAFYGDQLGIRVALDREFPQWGVRLIFCKVGDLVLEIASRIGSHREPSPLDSEDGDDAEVPASRDSLWGCSWRVADADAAAERLASAGLDVSEVRKGRKPGTRVLTVRDGTGGVPTLMLEPPKRED